MAKAARQAKPLATTPKVREISAEVMKAVLVNFIEPEARAEENDGGNIADPWAGKGTEAPSNLTPAADWKTPGEYIDGDYLGFTSDVGPNKSRLYHLKHRGSFVSVWGATILDQRMDALQPPRGAQVMIQYLGDVETGRRLNAAKNFRVKVQ